MPCFDTTRKHSQAVTSGLPGILTCNVVGSDGGLTDIKTSMRFQPDLCARQSMSKDALHLQDSPTTGSVERKVVLNAWVHEMCA